MRDAPDPEVFDHDDAGYIARRDEAAPLFVANEDDSRITKLHRSDCRMLRQKPYNAEHLTHAHPKAISANLATLIAWSTGRGRTARSCRMCNPFRVAR